MATNLKSHVSGCIQPSACKMSTEAVPVRIAALAPYQGTQIQGIFRLACYQSRTDRYGRPYWRVLLEDRSGSLRVYGWSGAFTPPSGVEIGQPVEAQVLVRTFNGSLIGNLLKLRPADTIHFNPIQLLPCSELPRPDCAEALERFIVVCPVPALQEFLVQVFRGENLARAFLTLPASQNHHHAWAGGLAEHSLEVAAIVEQALVKDCLAVRSVGVVAALLHDIGKIRVLDSASKRTSLGFVLHHEHLTLEILADGLRFLDSAWPHGAIALRYLLTWKRTRSGSRPLLPAALALEYADSYSAATQARDLAFSDKPEWQRFVKLGTGGPPSLFWRPLPPWIRR